jgi:hypothetical protein
MGILNIWSIGEVSKGWQGIERSPFGGGDAYYTYSIDGSNLWVERVAKGCVAVGPERGSVSI